MTGQNYLIPNCHTDDRSEYLERTCKTALTGQNVMTGAVKTSLKGKNIMTGAVISFEISYHS